jgi:uncharacterized protein
MKIKIKSGDVEIEAELNGSNTAKKIYENLPLNGEVKIWGEEVYFDVPVEIGDEEDAKEEVEVGELGYWLQGNCFCIFFGKTPASTGEKPRAASKVNVFGKLRGDFEGLRRIEKGDGIIIEKG